MSGKWGCWSQKIKGQCYLTKLETLEYEIQNIRKYLSILEKKEKRLKQSLQRSNFVDLLKVEGTYLDGYALLPAEIEPIRSTKKDTLQEACTFTPDTCAGSFWFKTRLNESLKVELRQAINQYNQLLSVCLQLQYFYEHTTPQLAYAHYFLKTIEGSERIIVLCSEMTNFLKNLPEQNYGKIYLFTSDTITQVAPESYLEFKYEKGTLYVLQMNMASLHRGLEEVLLNGLEEFSKVLSPYLSGKRYLPISKLQGELGVEKYASRAVLIKAYLKNNFIPHGKDYPDGTYLPYQIMQKNI